MPTLKFRGGQLAHENYPLYGIDCDYKKLQNDLMQLTSSQNNNNVSIEIHIY